MAFDKMFGFTAYIPDVCDKHWSSGKLLSAFVEAALTCFSNRP
jgi:hypothetical protein